MILHTTYFGSVDWYAQIVRSQEPVTIDGKERFVKQTERNHCLIATANGVQKLTVPVTLPSGGKTPICDVRISDHGNWRHLHWQALSSAYGMSPFFDYYADDIRPFFERKWEYLFDYNYEIAQKMMELVNPNDHVNPSTAPLSGEGMTSRAESYAPLNPIYFPSTGSGAGDGVSPYYQTFQRRHGFLPGMSILDLLFNMGPEALLVLRNVGN